MAEIELIPSPCIGNCCLDDNDMCLGCYRDLNEIKIWSISDSAARQIILKNAEVRRECYQRIANENNFL
jgi:uncharacterized protein